MERVREPERYKETWGQWDTHIGSAREAQTTDRRAEKERGERTSGVQKSMALASATAPGPSPYQAAQHLSSALPTEGIILNALLFLPLPGRDPRLRPAPTLTPNRVRPLRHLPPRSILGPPQGGRLPLAPGPKQAPGPQVRGQRLSECPPWGCCPDSCRGPRCALHQPQPIPVIPASQPDSHSAAAFPLLGEGNPPCRPPPELRPVLSEPLVEDLSEAHLCPAAHTPASGQGHQPGESLLGRRPLRVPSAEFPWRCKVAGGWMALAGLVCKHSQKPLDCSCVQVCERPMRKPRRTC